MKATRRDTKKAKKQSYHCLRPFQVHRSTTEDGFETVFTQQKSIFLSFIEDFVKGCYSSSSSSSSSEASKACPA